MDWHTFLFWTVAGLTGLCAIAVVVAQNIVRAAAWLLFTLAGTSGIYFLLGADFVGATQLIIYVGGVLVLVVFGVMLTAQGPFITMKTGAAEWAVAAGVGVLLLGVLVYSAYQAVWPTPPAEERMADAARSPSSVVLGETFLGIEEVMPRHGITGMPGGPVPERRRIAYLLPFEIVSVHLLVVLIGAAYLARAKRRRGPRLRGEES
jgi:NADH-quinone oxidoreductase subunit J